MNNHHSDLIKAALTAASILILLAMATGWLLAQAGVL